MRLRPAVHVTLGLLATGAVVAAVATMWRDPGARNGGGGVDDRAGGQAVEVTEYRPPPPSDDDLQDDRLEDRHPGFVADRVDRRRDGDWSVNASAAVLKLDTPMLRPDHDEQWLALRPTFASALAAAPAGMAVLPSVNLIDGKAKQFDDGLLAAIESARFRGRLARLPGDVAVIERLNDRVGAESVASPFLAAGLKIAGVDARTERPREMMVWLAKFEASAPHAKPLGFHDWSEDLARAYRFERFLQEPKGPDVPGLIPAMAQALESDATLLGDYKKAVSFRARLTNPPGGPTLADVVAKGGAGRATLLASVFPASGTKEGDLFRRAFPDGLPPDADLMRVLIRAIRAGTVDLTPGPDSGWYDYQVHALETLLFPERGPEHDKLLLTRAYKKRMLEAFQAMLTRRRETFVGAVAPAAAPLPARPLAAVRPRLRVEPCPTYYLRMARSYDFVSNLLAATIGEEALAAMHGLKEGGRRTATLLEELRWMREFYYGLHLLSAEDIGMAPGLRPDERVDRPACEARAAEWLSSFARDPDLAVDARVCVPIQYDVKNRQTRVWVTAGVRLARLDASYARPPKVRPADGTRDWQEVQPEQLADAEYAIAVEEFAEASLPDLDPLTRKEFRAICDAHRTRAAIVEALRSRLP